MVHIFGQCIHIGSSLPEEDVDLDEGENVQQSIEFGEDAKEFGEMDQEDELSTN